GSGFRGLRSVGGDLARVRAAPAAADPPHRGAALPAVRRRPPGAPCPFQPPTRVVAAHGARTGEAGGSVTAVPGSGPVRAAATAGLPDSRHGTDGEWPRAARDRLGTGHHAARRATGGGAESADGSLARCGPLPALDRAARGLRALATAQTPPLPLRAADRWLTSAAACKGLMTPGLVDRRRACSPLG